MASGRNRKCDIGKKAVSTYVDAELVKAAFAAGEARGMRREELVTRALTLLMEELCEPVPVSAQRRLERPFPDQRGRPRRSATAGD